MWEPPEFRFGEQDVHKSSHTHTVRSDSLQNFTELLDL
jgi:hypothetical protein